MRRLRVVWNNYGGIGARCWEGSIWYLPHKAYPPPCALPLLFHRYSRRSTYFSLANEQVANVELA